MAALSLAALALTTSSCVEPARLTSIPDTSAYVGAIGLLVEDGRVTQVFGYDEPPPLDRVELPEAQDYLLFVYDRPVADLGLDLPLQLVDAQDPRAVGLPVASAAWALEIEGAARWVPLESRPRAVEDLRLRGVTTQSCAELGGCFLTEAARDRLQCAFDCADQIDFDVRVPELPRLDVSTPCRGGWVTRDDAWALDPLLSDVADEVLVRRCAAPPDAACPGPQAQLGLEDRCAPLSACEASARRARIPAGVPVVYVPEPISGGPQGPAAESLAQADAAAEPGAYAVLGPGTWELDAAPQNLAGVLGACAADTTVRLGQPWSGGVLEDLRLVPEASSWAGLRLARVEVTLPSGRGFSAPDARFDQVWFRGDEAPVSPAVIELGGQAALERGRVDGAAAISIAPGATVTLRDVRIQPTLAGVVLDVRGEVQATDVAIEGPEAWTVAVRASGSLRATGLSLVGSAPPVAASLRVEGQAELVASRLEQADVLVHGEDGELVLRDSSATPGVASSVGTIRAERGARLELAQVVTERVRVELVEARGRVSDVVSKGQALLRVDPRTPEEDEDPPRFVALVADGSTLTAERVAFVDTPSAVAGRRAFSARLADVVVSRPNCEPFAFGPGPFREGLDQQLRQRRRCNVIIYPGEYAYPHPAEDYMRRFEVELDGVWVRSAGLAGPFRNELQVVGAGRFVARDIRFVRTTSRGLFIQGDVDFDVRRTRFENAGIQGACFFPGYRLEPTPDFGVGARDPSGVLAGARADGMDVGYYQLVGPDVEPDVEITDLTVRDATRGIVRARADDRSLAVPLDLEAFLIRNALVDVGDLQGPTVNPSCD